MTFKYLIVVSLSLVLVELHSPSTNSNTIRFGLQETSKSWRPANYKGLILGQSMQSDVLRIFGKPKRQDFIDKESETYPEVWYVYDDGGEFPGELIVGIEKKTDRVTSITLYPENLTKESAIERFGKDYELRRYDFCPGFEETETAPLYQSDQGNALFVEYASLGIAISIGYRGVVNEINYLQHPVGLSSKRECQEALAKRRSRPPKPKG